MFMGSKDHDLKNCARIRLYDRILHTTIYEKKKIVKLLVVIFVHFEERFFFPSRYDLRLLIPETRDKMLLVIKMCDYYCKNVYGIIYLKINPMRLHNPRNQIVFFNRLMAQFFR